jgi:large conductance mechanosensitive channel
MSMLQEFKNFAIKGNVMDLAVGVIIGAAFGKIVDSVVNDLIMPILGRATGGLDFSNYFFTLSNPPADYKGAMTYDALTKAGVPLFAYGNFITVAINFVILAFVIFITIIVIVAFLIVIVVLKGSDHSLGCSNSELTAVFQFDFFFHSSGQ